MAYDVELKSKLWGNLPQEILEGSMLPRLPLESIFKFRRVRKRWNDLPASPEFRNLCGHVQSQSNQLLLIPRMESSKVSHMFNLNKVSWSLFGLDYLLESFCSLKCEMIDKVATDGGLLCVQAKSNDHRRKALIVCNPLTKEWKALPVNPLVENWPLDDELWQSQWWQRCGREWFELSQCMLAMRVDQAAYTYQVFIIGDEQWKDKGSRLQMYDSKSDSWKLLAAHDVFSPIISGVLFNDLIYIVCNNNRQDVGEFDVFKLMKLATYNVKQDNWVDIDLTFESGVTCEGALLVINDVLYFVSSSRVDSEGNFLGDIQTIYIFEVKLMTGECSVRTEMPKHLFDHLFTSSGRYFSRFRNWAVIVYGDAIIFNSPLSGNLVMYNTSSGSWGVMEDLMNRKGSACLSTGETSGVKSREMCCMCCIRFNMHATVKGRSICTPSSG